VTLGRRDDSGNQRYGRDCVLETGPSGTISPVGFENGGLPHTPLAWYLSSRWSKIRSV
jgi:hypothetical protein